MKNFDIIIIGGGPAGLTAGLYASRRNLKTLVVSPIIGGQMSLAPSIENYPGVNPIPGIKLAEKMKRQAKKFGCAFKQETVVSLELKDEIKKVKTHDNEYYAKAIIIATGSHYRKLEAEGEDKFIGRGVSYCAVCDMPFFKNKKVAIIGGSDTAVKSAIYASEIASEVYLIHRRDQLRAEEANQKILEKSKVKIIWNSVVDKIQGDKFVDKIIIKDVNTNETKELAVDGVFIEIGEVPTTEIMKTAGIEINEKNFIKVNEKLETNIPGVFAAGDVTGAFAQIIVADAQGAEAATNTYLFLKGGVYGERKPPDYGEKK